MGQRILLIEDDEKLGTQVAEHLRLAGYEVTWWREGRPVSSAIAQLHDLLVLDLMLPEMYGLDILKGLRTTSELPVLVLSARVDAADKVRAFKLGADDYLSKPFWPEELLERVRARLRRPLLQRPDRIELGTLVLDLLARKAQVGTLTPELTRLEFELLLALARRPGEAVARAWLVEHVLDANREGDERRLDVHVSRLRKKLGEGNPIETVWGIGYRLAVSR